jgi:transposase InsO family protein
MMMKDNELELWKMQLGLSKVASDLIDSIRRSEPVRSVGGSERNVTGRYPSRKMGKTIQFESHSCELPFILLCEFPKGVDDIREYWDQPIKFQVTYKSKSGRTIRTCIIPDFFVMSDGTAEFVECKPEEVLIKLAAAQPNKFCLDADGYWHCPPGEEAAAKYGIRYRVFSTAEIDRTLIRNIIFMEDFLRYDVPALPNEITALVTEIVLQDEGIKLSTLLAGVEEAGSNADAVYQLIARGDLYVDLSQEALINYDRVFVYSSKLGVTAKDVPMSLPKGQFIELKVGELIQWGDNMFEIANLDQNNVWLIGEMDNHPTVPREHFEHLIQKGEVQGTLTVEAPSRDLSWQKTWNNAKPKAQKEAQRRYDLLMKHYRREPLDVSVPLRTLRLWSSNYKRAELFYGRGLIGLIPGWDRRGDRSTQRISPPVRKLITELIENDYERNVQSGMYAVYGKLRLACKAIQEKLPAYMTFVRYIRKRPQHEQELKRMGSKAAYASEPFYFYLQKDTPRHGDRPFEICHIDHTLLDIELIDPATGQNFGRPWATFLVDAFTRRILVVYLAFEAPSYRTCMTVLRDCVRRFSRLPQILVVDRGPNFTGDYFAGLTAAFEITIKCRPRAKARFGSVIENLFNVSNEQFLYNLTGNTQLTRKNVRHVTPSHDPRKIAVWSLGPLYERLCDWAYNRYDVTEHSTLKQSPRSLYANTIRLTGERSHCMITYNEDFKVLTLPTTKKGTAKNIKNKGVKINNEYYFDTILDDRALLDKQLPVKYDPYNYSIAWIYAYNKWVKCLSQDHYQIRGLNEAEMRIHSAEKSRRNTMFYRRAGERAEQQAQGVLEDQNQEAVLSKNLAVLRGQQREDAGIRKIIDGEMADQMDGVQSVSTLESQRRGTDTSKCSTAFSTVAEDEVQTLEEYV